MLSKNKVFALAIALIIVGALATVFSRGLAVTPYVHYDEFSSLERSTGFSKFHDWLHVYSINKPSTRKPPLQYWLNAINIKLGVSEFLAFRLWSYVFFLGAIVVTGLVAVRLCNNNLWALPAAMLLTGGSYQLIVAGRSAMLDSGQCFFLMATLLSFFYAKTNPRWWLVCGAMAGLGALQKSPVALLVVGIILFALNKRGDSYYRWRNLRQIKQFNAGYYLALALFISWPLLQTVLDGMKYLRSGIQHEMLARFSPFGDDRIESGDFLNWLSWLWDDVQITGMLALACVFFMLATKRWRNDNEIMAIVIVALVVMLGFSLATGTLYPRYLVILTPLLIVLLVRCIHDTMSWKPAGVVFAVAMTVLAVPRMQAAMHPIFDKAGSSFEFYVMKAMIERLDAVRESDDVVFIDSKSMAPGAYGYFGKSTEPYMVRKVTDESEALERAKRELASVKEPVLGIISAQKAALVEAIAGTYQVVYRDDRMLIWRRPPLHGVVEANSRSEGDAP